DARTFDPLATSAGEREEWDRLRAALRGLEERVERRDAAAVAPLTTEIGRSIDRLVQINRDAARAQAQAIRRVHRQAILADASVGVLTVGLVSMIALVLLRVLRRQRALTGEYIALIEERNRELDAFAARTAHD